MQYFTDDKGVVHEFPDDATPEEIDAATGGGGVSKSGASSPPTGGSGAGPSSSVSADQPSTFSLQHLQNVLHDTGARTYDELRALNRGITLGYWDDLVGGAKQVFGAGSPAEERRKTMEAKSRLPLNGAIPETAGTALTTYLTGGLAPEIAIGATGARAIPNLATRIVAKPVVQSAGTGAVLSGLQSEADRDSPGQTMLNMGLGGLFSAGVHGLTSGASRVGKWWSGTPTKPPNTASQDFKNMTQEEWDQIKDYVYPRTALDQINQSAQAAAKNDIRGAATGTPITETSVDRPTRKLYEKFDERFDIPTPTKGQTGKPGTPVWPSEVDKWRNDALDLDTPHGDALAGQLETLMQGGPTVKLTKLGEKPEIMTPEVQQGYTDRAYSGILAARNARAKQLAADVLDEAQKTGSNAPIIKALHSRQDMPAGVYEVLNQANKGDVLSRSAERVNKVAPALAKLAVFPAAGLAGMKGELAPLAATGAGAIFADPLAKITTQPISDAMRARMLQAARDQLTGAVRPRPDTSAEDAFRRMLLGTWLSQQQ